MDKINISDVGEQQTEQLFNNSSSQSYDEDLQAQASQLINQVFNTSYEPIFNPSRTKQEQERYNLQKQQQNKRYKHKLAHHHKVYQNLDDKDLPGNFRQFLSRAQQKIDCKTQWVKKMKNSQQDKESRTLKEIPDILRGSRERIVPIYQRCINLQKQKEKKNEQKRITKLKNQSQMIKNMSFRPTIKTRGKQRTFQEYFVDKQLWKKEKDQVLEIKRVRKEVQTLSQCTFTPVLVAKYNKPNSKFIPGEKVEDRLLRSLQRSVDKT